VDCNYRVVMIILATSTMLSLILIIAINLIKESNLLE
jgi:hypothetical protein